jgi:DNA polymerase elongation subunit (family B)
MSLQFSFLLSDWRMAAPVVSLDDPQSAATGRVSSRVPVVRFYGYTSGGRQCVLNIHGYYPRVTMETIQGLSRFDVVDLIDRKLSTSELVAHVRNVTVVTRTNIFGFNENPVELWEIELFRPPTVAQVAELVSTPGALGIPNFASRVFEVHIPYLLQVLVDYGIQGVTPFEVINAVETRPKSTHVNLEFSVHVSGVIARQKNHEKPPYPVPPPLSSTPGNDALVCQVLQTLWEEEHERSVVVGKRPFPYQPEGMVDGLTRPDCADMHLVTRRDDMRKKFLAFLQQSEAGPPMVSPTQLGLVDASDGYDLSIGANAAMESSQEDEDICEPTLVMPGVENSPPVFPPTLVQQPSEEKPVLIRAPSPIPSVPSFPTTRTVLRYTIPPPPRAAAKVTRRALSLSDTQAPGAPIRSGKPLEKLCEDFNPIEFSFGTMVVLDVLIEVARGETVDSELHAILAICMHIVDERDFERKIFLGVVRGEEFSPPSSFVPCNSEGELLENFRAVFLSLDPAVVLAWDNNRYAIAYIQQRAQALGLDRLSGFSLSRVVGDEAEKISGRLILDLWKILRNDVESGVKLGTTDFVGTVHAVLGRTIPNLPNSVLASWWKDGKRVLDVLNRMGRVTDLIVELADTVRVLPKATEMARIYGMSIESAFTRGSQYRVECMLVRAARQLGFILPSSSKGQVKNQAATEGIPLVLEPKSGLITDPVCVFDFQSLYPSVVIGYNICYSTCLGRAAGDAVTKLGPQDGLKRYAKNIAKSVLLPGDCMFVQRNDRVGIIPRLCHEILQTRIMVKRAMKHIPKSSSLYKKLDARQLSLKLLSNVIYGYTTASFSGRMPCAEIADAILLTARASLETVMNRAESLGGEIVYGDTDSLFVRLRGHSVESAMAWGTQLVNTISSEHPWPMNLIFEKVYWPCCLVTKKRYVGRAFDPGTSSASSWLDAKGIETIRRDTCPAVAVSIEKILNSVYDDVTSSAAPLDPVAALERACITQFSRLLRGVLPLKYFVFQNQVRAIEDYKDQNHLPPAARVAADVNRTDTVRGDRIAYVIVKSGAGNKLSDQVRPPRALLEDEILNLDYYLTKQVVPSVQRIFGPIANRAFVWLATAKGRGGDMEDYYGPGISVACALCGNPTASAIFGASNAPMFCQSCTTRRPAQCVAQTELRLSTAEGESSQLRKICMHCSGGSVDAANDCVDAYHCEVYFKREIARKTRTSRSQADRRMRKMIRDN